MKKFVLFLSIMIAVFSFVTFQDKVPRESLDYDIYQYVRECKAELGIDRSLPRVSCLDGKQVPIFVNQQEIQEKNWPRLSRAKKCDNPHWLGGDMGCWTYSHLQVVNLDDENVMVVNCRQKGGQDKKNWYRDSRSNLGMNQEQRKSQFEKTDGPKKTELYYLYNTFNDLGIIFRNIKTGKSCYLTQYGDSFSGFLPPLDRPLPEKSEFFKGFKPEQARPPKDFPEKLWYRDANQAFKSPQKTAAAGCINCHNAHGFKYSPYINSTHGLPSIYGMVELPMLLVGEPFKNHFRNSKILQLTTELIDGEEQLCTRCHKMTTSGTCGYLFDFAIGHPSMKLHQWLTTGTKVTWMPPVKVDVKSVNRHITAMGCCCKNPQAKGCKTRQIGPTLEDLPEGFFEGKGWVSSQGDQECI